MEDNDEFYDTENTFDIFKLKRVAEKIEWPEYNALIYHAKRFATEILHKLHNWDYNRFMDAEHMQNIKSSIIAQKSPLLFGDIYIAMDKAYRCVVINGQHRIAALNEIIQEQPDYDIVLDFTIIQLNHIENIYDDKDGKNIAMLDKIYNIVNMSYNCNNLRQKELYALNIAKQMAVDPELKPGIVLRTNSITTRKPKISVKELKDYLYRYLPADYATSIDVNNFIRKVKLKNKEFSLMSISEIYGRISPAKNKTTQYQKAIELKFYINLDGVCSPDNWIKKCMNFA